MLARTPRPDLMSPRWGSGADGCAPTHSRRYGLLIFRWLRQLVDRSANLLRGFANLRLRFANLQRRFASLIRDGRFEIIGKILLGRRSEYDNALNNMREQLYNANPSIEVISYDRILDVLNGLRRQ
jgi:hypothetical protein